MLHGNEIICSTLQKTIFKETDKIFEAQNEGHYMGMALGNSNLVNRECFDRFEIPESSAYEARIPLPQKTLKSIKVLKKCCKVMV